MKYLVGVGILIIGLLVGFFIGRNSMKLQEETDMASDGFITETVYDTIIKTETVEVPVEVEDEEPAVNDTLIAESDSLEMLSPPDSLYEDLPIRTEELKDSKWMNVIVLEEEQDEDSLINEMMEIEDKKPSKILVEFWESPLHFSGYKLSKSKLILYDLPAGLDYKLYRNRDEYYLSTQSLYYSLKETEEFLPYLEVPKEVVFND